MIKRHYYIFNFMSISTITFNTTKRILECMLQRIRERILIIDRGFNKTVICINVFIYHERHLGLSPSGPDAPRFYLSYQG